MAVPIFYIEIKSIMIQNIEEIEEKSAGNVPADFSLHKKVDSIHFAEFGKKKIIAILQILSGCLAHEVRILDFRFSI